MFVAAVSVVHEIYFDQYAVIRPKGCNEWIIGYTLSGRGMVHAGKQESDSGKGHLFFLPPDLPHSLRTAPGLSWELAECRFIPNTAWSERFFRTLSFRSPLFLQTSEHPLLHGNLEDAFLRMIRYAGAGQHGRKDDLTLNALEEILLLLSDFVKQDGKTDPRIQEILDWMERHYAEPVSVERIAKHVCLSPSRLAHLFKEQTGETLMERMTKIRLRHAERRLLSSAATVTEIAMESGFNSPEHFSRQFVKHYNTTPQRYRKSRCDNPARYGSSAFLLNNLDP